MAAGGRITCADVVGDRLSDAIEMHAGPNTRVDTWFRYTQLNSRRCPVWSDIWRLRCALQDFLEASDGYQHKQKDVVVYACIPCDALLA